MKHMVVFTYGLNHTLLGLISTYIAQAEMSFSFPPEKTQLTTLDSGKQKIQILIKNKAHFIFSSLKIAYLLRKGRYDVVYVHGINSRNMLPALMGAKLARVPRVIACGHGGQDKPISPLASCCFHKATASNETLNKKMFNSHARVLPDGIAFKHIFDNTLRQAWRTALSLTDKDVYLQVSAFNSSSQYDQTLDSFHKILALNKNAHLICIGQGPLRSEILSRIDYENLSNSVTLPGDTDNIAPFLMAADALLIPDTKHQNPELLAIAQVAGLPCFVGDETDSSTSLIKEGIYSLKDVFDFQLPWDERIRISEHALKQAQQTNRTSELIGKTLIVLARKN